MLNGQILIEAIRFNLHDAVDPGRAVHDTATQRLRPVLATAITDAIGFLPWRSPPSSSAA